MKFLITNVKKMVKEIYPKEYFEKKKKLIISDSPFSTIEKSEKPLADFTKFEMQHFINLGKRHLEKIQKQHEAMAKQYIEEMKLYIAKDEVIQKIIENCIKDVVAGKKVYFGNLNSFCSTCGEEEKLAITLTFEQFFSSIPDKYFLDFLQEVGRYEYVYNLICDSDSVFERTISIQQEIENEKKTS